VITVVDYGMGNLRNVRRAFEELGERVVVTSDAREVEQAAILILPGVGAFGEAARRIDQLGLREPILRAVERRRPLLGICLGMQLLYEHSEESPGADGLGILKGTIRRFARGQKVPHIGWNDVAPVKQSLLFPDAGGVFYFVHSYFAPEGAETLARAEYGEVFGAAVGSERVFGVQFHPEKSQAAGLAMLERFVQVSGKSGSDVRLVGQT
jgi:imidazole glycerol-phosphate synthase subunit HisH